jgi:cyclic pyranopterin phosphate synthase
MTEFTHLDESGAARMVDVSSREVTDRASTASGRVLLSPATVAMIRDAKVPKGDVLSTARLAGIMGAKRTSDLIPLCHPIAITFADVTLSVEDWGVAISADVRIKDRTGVEMEALTAVSIAGLTIIDMVKSVDPAAVLTEVSVATKSGGRSGEWRSPNG